MNSCNHPEVLKHNYPGSKDLIERGIVTFSSTTISLLGIDLLGIHQLKIVTTLDTWLGCADLI